MTKDELRRTPFQDLYKLKEDDRIDLIGHYVTEHNKTVAFMTDSGPGDEKKAARYIKKIQEKFPTVYITKPEPGPVPNTVVIRVSPSKPS